MKIGVTGHQQLEKISDWAWVKSVLGESLKKYEQPLVGITSLAIGADQIFAKLILDLSGTLHVIVPFAGYDRTFKTSQDSSEYLRLLKRADKIEVLESKGSEDESYLNAGKRVVELSDLMFIVWNGNPAVGLGGTGDIAKYAKSVGKKTVHFNPVTKSIG